MLILAWGLAVLALILLVFATLRLIRAHEDRAFIRRIEQEIGFVSQPRNQLRLSERELADMHRSRWEGD
jgi:hypothetical protein